MDKIKVPENLKENLLANQVVEIPEEVKERLARTAAITMQINNIKEKIEIAKHIGVEGYNELYHPRPYLLKVIKELIADGR